MGCFLSRGYVLMQDVLSVGGRNDFYGNTEVLDADFGRKSFGQKLEKYFFEEFVDDLSFTDVQHFTRFRIDIFHEAIFYENHSIGKIIKQGSF